MRTIYGAGPVREVIARRAKTVRASGSIRSAPIAARAIRSRGIVIAARDAGIRVEDRDRDDARPRAGEGARHQGVVAWLGPFVYADAR